MPFIDLMIKLLSVGRERDERRDSSDFSGCLAIATVGQKAMVGQGLPNTVDWSQYNTIDIDRSWQ